MSGIYIPGMEMARKCIRCPVNVYGRCLINDDKDVSKVTADAVRDKDCPLIPVPDHGRLIDADALVADLKRQCKEVFKTDAVSPDDFWITRNQAYNERLWTTWCESLFDYLKAAPTIIPAEDGEG